MNVEERIARYLKTHPRTDYCDDCLAELLVLKDRRQARHPTAALKAAKEFNKDKRICSECGREKLVTRAV